VACVGYTHAHSTQWTTTARQRQATQAEPVARTAPPTRKRIHGIDVARALAIVGMVMVHIGPTGEEAPGLLGRIYSLPHGRASLLFGLLAGIGVSLMARGRGQQQRRVLWRRMGFRAVLLLPLGLGLQLLDHNVAVILQYYALFFVAVAAAASLSDRALLTGAGLGVLAGPVAYLAVWHLRPGWFGTPEAALTDAPSVTARDLLVAGTYPLITWVGPLLFGMWLGRQDLRARGVRLQLVVGGAACAVGAWTLSWLLERALGEPAAEPSWLQLVTDTAHSQMPLWLVGSTGAAVGVLGMALLAAERWPTLTRPLAGIRPARAHHVCRPSARARLGAGSAATRGGARGGAERGDVRRRRGRPLGAVAAVLPAGPARGRHPAPASLARQALTGR
jgi:uncharacterized membrane protein